MRNMVGLPMTFSAALAGLLLLSGCDGGEETNLASLDNAIAAADADPALTSALDDEILVDPALVGQSNPNSVRPPERPLQAPYPLDLGRPQSGGAVRPAAGANLPAPAPGPGPGPEGPIAGACGSAFRYGPEWAERLPAGFPAYPGGRVTQAAGSDVGDCRVRVVTFTTVHDWRQVLEWYRGVAVRAGFNHEHQRRGGDHVLGGVNARSDGAYYLIVTPVADGSEVALIVNHGR